MTPIEKIYCLFEFIYVIRYSILCVFIGFTVLIAIDFTIWNKTKKSFLRDLWL